MYQFDSINKIYSALFRQHGDSSQSVMIPKNNQSIRYASISSNISKSRSFSYLDYGCGLAHQKKFFDHNGYTNLSYSGVDVNDDFIKFCNETYPDSNFTHYDDFWANPETYDYVGAVGTFGLVSVSEQDHWSFVKMEILKLWSITKKSLFLNFMSNQVDFMQDGAYHQDLGLLYEFVCKNISRVVRVDSSYLPYEYTFIIERN
jgi:hypothetical protein